MQQPFVEGENAASIEGKGSTRRKPREGVFLQDWLESAGHPRHATPVQKRYLHGSQRASPLARDFPECPKPCPTNRRHSRIAPARRAAAYVAPRRKPGPRQAQSEAKAAIP